MFVEDPLLTPNDAIIVFGILRSGSTLVYNVLKELQLERPVFKTHSFCENLQDRDIIITVRDFRDASVSLWRAQNAGASPNRQITTEDFENQCLETYHIPSTRDALNKYLARACPNQLFLRYEDFVSNWSFLFAKLEQFFGITIARSERLRLMRRFGADKMRTIAARLNGFAAVDPETELHGNHLGLISPGQYLSAASPELRELWEVLFAADLREWGYAK